MRISRSCWGAFVISGLCLTLMNYILLPLYISVHRESAVDRLRIIRRATKYEGYCIEENICKNSTAGHVYTYVDSPNLYRLINGQIDVHRSIVHEKRVVPSIVHYTWYAQQNATFAFHHMLAVLSAQRCIHPDRIYFWHEIIPTGAYWDEVLVKVPVLCPIVRKPPTNLRNISVDSPEVVVSLEALIQYGGMYFDLDVVVLQSLGGLLNYDLVMGYESDLQLGKGIIIAKQGADFLKVWHKAYNNTLSDLKYVEHSERLLTYLAKRYPNIVHTEVTSLRGPRWNQLHLLYKEGVHYDWRRTIYASHLWMRFHKQERNAVDIKTWNTTAGEMFRWIYYGDWRINKTSSTTAVCVLDNICKKSNNDLAYYYTRHLHFSQKVDSPVDWKRNSEKQSRVPNIVHFIWYNGMKKKNTFRFHHFISILAAHKYVKPEVILLWHDTVPGGKYWEKIRQTVPELALVYRKIPTKIRGAFTAHVHEQFTDLVKLEAVMEFGGIYIDFDAIVLKSLEPLLQYDVTMGYDTYGGLCTDIFIGQAWAPFFKVWHNEFGSFYDSDWVYESAKLPTSLAKRHPKLIHTKERILNIPNVKEFKQLVEVGHLYKWRQSNYAVHLSASFHELDTNPENIKLWNTTIGEILRYVYYGDVKNTDVINSEKMCIYNNICKGKDSDTAYKYIRLPDFVNRIDASVNFNVNISNVERIIPNISHFTWYGGLEKVNIFRFHHMIAVIAVHRFLKPERILLWHDIEPEGKYWTEVKEKVPELTLVYQKAPTKIRGRRVSVREHLTDIVRLEAILEFGGIYLDLDVIVLKPLGHLLNYDVVMGYESQRGLCNGIIISKPWAGFLRMWHKEYNSFTDVNWNYHSVILPAMLAVRHPAMIHTEQRSMHRPNWQEIAWLYDLGKLYDWRKDNYAVHLWIRFHHIEHNATDIKTWNTTTGEIFRYVYYGDWRIKT